MISVTMIQRLNHPVTQRLLLQAISDQVTAVACCRGYGHSMSGSSNRTLGLSVHPDMRGNYASLPHLPFQQNSVFRATNVSSDVFQICSSHILCGRNVNRQTVGFTEIPRCQVKALHKPAQLLVKSASLPQAFVEAAPSSWQPYMRLVRWDKPIGNWLLFLPCTWSISLAAPAGQLPDLQVLALFGLGAVLMRGAGCTVNDMWDKDIDKKVIRTQGRPIAADEISRTQALGFLAVQLSASLAILLSFDWNTVILGASCLGLLVTYPLMKRVTYWPQLFLGLGLVETFFLEWFCEFLYSTTSIYHEYTPVFEPGIEKGVVFNWGALLGWSAVHGSCDWAICLPLYVTGVSWTLMYDTVYGHQDKQDDIMVGVKSTALKFGDDSKYWLSGFATVMVTGLAATGHLCDQTWPYFAGVGFVAAHLSHQIYSTNLNSPDDCGRTFRSNRNLGLIFWAFIIAANMLKEPNKDEEEEREAVAMTL